MVVVRQEQPKDVAAIRLVTEQAFGRVAEAHLIEALRIRDQVTLSLVAERAGHIVGHCLFSPVLMADARTVQALVGLGPAAVLPVLQRQGIGARLILEGLVYCRQEGYAGVVVLGHPAYYPRFGFVPASRYGIICQYAVLDEAFMAVELYPGALHAYAGLATYQPEFDAV